VRSAALGPTFDPRRVVSFPRSPDVAVRWSAAEITI